MTVPREKPDGRRSRDAVVLQELKEELVRTGIRRSCI